MFFDYLNDILPLNRILVSSALGLVSFILVLAGGLSSDYVTGSVVATRALYALASTAAVTFCLMMCCEEYAVFNTKRELEHFIDDAALAETDNFNRDDYLGSAENDDDLQPIDFDN